MDRLERAEALNKENQKGVVELRAKINQLEAQVELLERQRQHEYYEDSASYFKMVKKFHEKFGLHVNDGPIDFSLESDEGMRLFELREELHNEEMNELNSAMDKEDSLVEVADAICDLIYVLCGTAVSFGIPLDECFAEVQRSNMSKLDDNGNPIVRDDGKILKGPNYSPPDLRSIIYREN